MTNLHVKEEVLRVSGVDVKKCMHCGKCSGTCPSFDKMPFSPHSFVCMVEAGDVGPLLESEALYHCLTCFACVERCPREVEPAKLIEAVRLAAIRQREKNHLLPDQVPALLEEDMPQQAVVSAFRKFTK